MQRTNTFKLAVLAALAAAVAFFITPRTAFGQDNLYALSYYSNAHVALAPDATLRLVNDGNVADTTPAGDLCASIYVFEFRLFPLLPELIECCSCPIAANGLLTLSVNTNLTSNPFTAVTPTRGVVKVVSSTLHNGICDPTFSSPAIGIRGWLTHIQRNSTFFVTETPLTDSTFGTSEAADLVEDCLVGMELGSGKGTCSCTDAGR